MGLVEVFDFENLTDFSLRFTRYAPRTSRGRRISRLRPCRRPPNLRPRGSCNHPSKRREGRRREHKQYFETLDTCKNINERDLGPSNMRPRRLKNEALRSPKAPREASWTPKLPLEHSRRGFRRLQGCCWTTLGLSWAPLGRHWGCSGCLWEWFLDDFLGPERPSKRKLRNA